MGVDDADDLFEEAARVIVRSQQGSVSLLQRKLSVGYTRAARIVDQLEDAGIVGPFKGSKAREVLVRTRFQLDNLLSASREGGAHDDGSARGSGDQFPLIGILGGGQLGRMLALAAIRMGLRIRTLTPKNDGPADGLGDTIFADWTERENLLDFATGCDVVTVESEWAPADLLLDASSRRARLSHSDTLRLIRDKGVQKERLQCRRSDAGFRALRDD
jgi:hypothetical protein